MTVVSRPQPAESALDATLGAMEWATTTETRDPVERKLRPTGANALLRHGDVPSALEGVIHADDRRQAAPEAGIGEGEQHAAGDKQVAGEVELDPAGPEQQCEVARSGRELIERSVRQVNPPINPPHPGPGRSKTANVGSLYSIAC